MRTAALLLVAACTRDAPPPAPAPSTVVPSGTVTGKVTFEMSGPGRAHTPAEAFTNISPIECTVHSGSASVRSAADGTYMLALPAGRHEVSFADCAKPCCPRELSRDVEVTAGYATTVDFACGCSAH